MIALVPASSADAPGAPVDGQASTANVWLPAGEFPGIDPVGSPGMGASVAVDGDVAVVGSTDIMGASDTDAVHVLHRDGGGLWSSDTILMPPGDDRSGKFGWAVALEGGVLAVSAPLADAGDTPWAGVVHVYHHAEDRWTKVDTVMASDPTGFGGFGRSLDLDDGRLLVGAPGAEASYVFERSGEVWAQAQKLGASGFSVGLDADTAAIGDIGVVSIYRYDGTAWALDTTHTGSGGLGFSVDVRGEHVLAGAPFETVDGLLLGAPATGAVQLLERSQEGWTIAARMGPSDLSPMVSTARFGASVELTADGFVVGGPREDLSPGLSPDPGDARVPCAGAPPNLDSCLRSGAAYLFRPSADGWTQAAKLTPPDGVSGAWFGYSVTASSDLGTVLVGAPLAGSWAGQPMGSAYVYTSSGGTTSSLEGASTS